MSKGTKEKVQLVLVMARKAQAYLLDEPIAGVDPAAQRVHQIALVPQQPLIKPLDHKNQGDWRPISASMSW